MMKKLLFSLVAILTATISMAQTGPTTAWVTSPADNAVLTIGDALPVSATYDAGDDGEGLDYTVGGTGSANLQFSISEKTGTSYVWKAGSNDGTTNGTHTGTSTKAWTVPDLTPSADLPEGTTHVLRVGFQNSNNAWASGAAEIPVTIVAGVALDAYSFNPQPQVFHAETTSLDVNIKYTSVGEDIAVGGIKFTMWTITDGTVEGVSLFSDKWHGVFTNPEVLPAGEDVEATITITIPASVKNAGVIRPSTDLGALWDPNAGDEGNNYVDHATTPAPSYFYQFRQVAGSDANFTPSTAQYAFTVDASAGLSEVELEGINVYPNPTTGLLTISDLYDAETISISNISGKLVKTFEANNSIDISDLPTGVYVLQTDNGLQRKVVKK
ncbi:T9SS type A sorting domain-containing protein [Flavicella sediminum]|uniref:T9SS type A sorting domain-containing protein n=1 Tax=Flavicella sediminum TaxID=2585141 RepID=UPI0011228F5F|nr:T9SS type A sorting domain-containing protein [Flavicella sediminum]